MDIIVSVLQNYVIEELININEDELDEILNNKDSESY